jgi:hypothetical protein
MGVCFYSCLSAPGIFVGASGPTPTLFSFHAVIVPCRSISTSSSMVIITDRSILTHCFNCRGHLNGSDQSSSMVMGVFGTVSVVYNGFRLLQTHRRCLKILEPTPLTGLVPKYPPDVAQSPTAAATATSKVPLTDSTLSEPFFFTARLWQHRSCSIILTAGLIFPPKKALPGVAGAFFPALSLSDWIPGPEVGPMTGMPQSGASILWLHSGL